MRKWLYLKDIYDNLGFMKSPYLGVDFGEKRVGIAISDEGGKIAVPKAVLPNNSALLRDIKDMVKTHGTQMIVLGESNDLKGVRNSIMDNIDRFKGVLEREVGVEVIYEPEFLTSHHAAQMHENKPNLDASAAALILQSYLDKKNNL